VYLEKILAITPSEHPTLVLSNLKYKELKLLVDFMYSGIDPINLIILFISEDKIIHVM